MRIHQHNTEDTIAAIATAPGVGAIGVIRVSGKEAIDKVNLLFSKKDLTKVKTHTLHYGPLQDGDFVLDEVLVSVFKAPRSYTGQNQVEISCHGSPYILQTVMEALIAKGVRPAQPGEFTLRAFMNGKLDLAQAEAVADLIVSESESAQKAAMYQMRGGFSAKIRDLRHQLLQFASLIELELDFAEEDVEFANRDALNELLNKTEKEVQKLAESFKLGNVVKSGVKVVIAGRPNAGKSTLLNNFLNEERAIVSEIPGTTRDVIEDVITIDGVRFRFIDTAGIRDTTDVLESIGIGRTMEKLREADLIIYLFDVNDLDADELKKDLESLPQEKTVVIVGNKIDKQPGGDYKDKFSEINDIVFISGKQGENTEILKKELVHHMLSDNRRLDDVLVTNIRHFTSLHHILTAITSIKEGFTLNLPTDLIAIDIRKALHEMAEITGEVTTDEILGNIFSQFCIGK
jgi:tRNA modification GTPase